MVAHEPPERRETCLRVGGPGLLDLRQRHRRLVLAQQPPRRRVTGARAARPLPLLGHDAVDRHGVRRHEQQDVERRGARSVPPGAVEQSKSGGGGPQLPRLVRLEQDQPSAEIRRGLDLRRRERGGQARQHRLERGVPVGIHAGTRGSRGSRADQRQQPCRLPLAQKRRGGGPQIVHACRLRAGAQTNGQVAQGGGTSARGQRRECRGRTPREPVGGQLRQHREHQQRGNAYQQRRVEQCSATPVGATHSHRARECFAGRHRLCLCRPYRPAPAAASARTP